MSSLRRPHARAASSDDEEGFSIPLTPLIDVVFLLLIFFLLATTFIDVEKDLGIKLPPSAHGRERHKAAESVVVNIHRDGTLVVNGRIVTAEELYKELDAAWQRDVYTAVVVRGDARASHGTVVGVLDICRKARIVNVAVATFERAESPTR